MYILRNKEGSSDFIKEYFTLKQDLDSEESFNDVQRRDLNKLFVFVETKLLKIESKSEIEQEKEIKRAAIDTRNVSRQLNKFLKENRISHRVFNDHIFRLSFSNCYSFCKNPKKWSLYKKNTQKRIKVVDEFLKNKEKHETFVEKCAVIDRNNEIPAPCINTFQLSRRVNQFLEENFISQKVFNTEIAKLSDYAMYEFLNRPKQFSRYYNDVQKKLVNLYNFMNDEERVEKFLEENERDESVEDSGLNRNQLDRLNEIFARDQYPSIELVESLSEKLSLSFNTILNWFESKQGDNEINPTLNTLQLSRQLNRFLKDNSISIRNFNLQIANMSRYSLYGFLKKPRRFSSYIKVVQEKILNIQGFLGDEKRVKQFLEKRMSQYNEDESTIQAVNTLQLSRQLNQFLKDNSISIRNFNEQIAKMSFYSLYGFLKKPRRFSSYIEVVQEKILNIQGFFGDEKRVKQFQEKSSKRMPQHNEDESTIQAVNTLQLSRQLNRFLEDNSISIKYFNGQIAKMSRYSLDDFLKKPRRFSSYIEVVQEKILNIQGFFNDENRVKQFLEKSSKRMPHSQFKEDESTIQPLNTLQLSRQLKRFLKENSISIKYFNGQIAKMSRYSLDDFLKKPRRFSSYIEVVQEKILNIQGFFGDEKRVKQFLESGNEATTTQCNNDSGSDYRVEFIKDENDII